MKSRSRSCSATALAAREHAIRRSAARFRRLPGPGRSSWNGCTIAVRANTRSIAARREHRCFHTPNALRCVSKHEEVTAAHPSRRAHARPDLRQRLRTRAPQDEAAQGIPSPRLIAEPFAVIPISRCQTAHLVPAAHVCARVLPLCFTHPESRGGRSADPPPGHPHVASVCPRLLQRLDFFSCAPLTSPLPSSGYIASNMDRALDARLEQALRLLRKKRSP